METIQRYISTIDFAKARIAYAKAIALYERYVPVRAQEYIQSRIDQFNALDKMYRVIAWCALLGFLWGTVLAHAEEITTYEYSEASYTMEEVVITDTQIYEVAPAPVITYAPVPVVHGSYVVNTPVTVAHGVDVAHPVSVAHAVDAAHPVTIAHAVDVASVSQYPVGYAVSIAAPVSVGTPVDVGYAVDVARAVDIAHPIDLNRPATHKTK